MNTIKIFFLCICSFLMMFLCTPFAFATDTHSSESFTIPVAQNQLIKLTDTGVSPAVLRMKVQDSALFILNETTDSLATIEIRYNGKYTHCASSNLEVIENDLVRSKRPFGAHDFASVCFHEKGEYPFKVYGIKPDINGIEGKIIVE